MRRIGLLLALSLCLGSYSFAQLSQGGTPYSFNSNKGLRAEVPVINLPAVDVKALLTEDAANADKIGPYRFGKEIPVFVTLENTGVREFLPNGNSVWRQAIHSEGAYSINLMFHSFFIPEGAKLFIYNDDKSVVFGAFTSKNNKPHGYFATDLIAGDHITLEYFEPAAVTGEGHFTLNTVVHAYKDVVNEHNHDRAGGGSGACNINVNCPLGDNWTNERNAVTRVVLGGGLCTGSLVNNTANDGTRYYLTANHCYQGTNVNNWVFRFNYQSSTCGGNSGPTNQSLTGATFRANNSGSDFALVEIQDPIPSNYNPYFAGWRNNNAASDSSYCIHHPSGDIKKISRDEDPTTTANWSGATTWRIGAWEDGTTEGGSSGSPLFDAATHQIIGQLYGGSAACSGSNPNNQSDYYGKFSSSWDGNSSSNRLRDWLDPGNTGATSVDGYDPNAPLFALDAGVVNITSPTDGATLCTNTVTPKATIKNYGGTTLTTLTIVLDIDGNQQTINWTGSLATNATEEITFNDVNLSPSAHTMTVTLSSPNGNTDQNTPNNSSQITFTTISGTTLTFTLTTDGYGGETSWELRDTGNNVLYSEPTNTYGSNQTYTVDMCVQNNACYTFTIFDDYGDGICCGEGQGSYSLKDENGIVVAEGGQFTNEESSNVCLPLAVELPDASFTSNAGNSICEGDIVQYNNQDTNSYPTTYAWTFEGGTPGASASANPAVGYNTSGTYDVRLIATNAFGADTMDMLNVITVLEAPSVSMSSTIETGGNSNGTATANASGGTSPYTYSWSPGGGNSITITGLSSGTYNVTVTDANGCSTTGQVIVDDNVGIDENDLAAMMDVYPNPTTGAVNITLPDNISANELLLFNVVGELVYAERDLNTSQLSFNITGLSHGIYYIRLTAEGQTATRKLVLTK